jgi:Fe-S-cluster containining protein
VSEDLDCRKCGLCCLSGNWNGPRSLPFVELGKREAARLWKKHPKLVVLDDSPPTGMAFKAPNSFSLDVKNGRCAALRGTVLRKTSCSIYKDRPFACREFEPGSVLCLAFRKRVGPPHGGGEPEPLYET